jgi:thiol-disulfide isomerase/thioredoxin
MAGATIPMYDPDWAQVPIHAPSRGEGMHRRAAISGCVIACLLFTSPAWGAIPADTLRALQRAAGDSASAVAALPRLRAWTVGAESADERTQVLWLLQIALLRSRGPADELVTTSDSLVLRMSDPIDRATTSEHLAKALVDRGERLDAARSHVEAALALAESNSDLRDVILGSALRLRARLQWSSGAQDSALTTMERAVATNREDQFPVMRELRLELADLYERAGRAEEGLTARVMVAGTWGSRDTSSYATLRERWIARRGSIAGLDAALEQERAASHQRLVFEAPRVDRALPNVRLPALAGDSLALTSLRGKVAVIDFWGTWCGPCVESMPKIQKLHETFGPRGVQVVGFGVEFQPKTLDEARQLVGAFMAKHALTFPTLIDLRGRVAEGLMFPAFPTTWVVDRSGRVRFQNAGSSEVTGRILEEQIESLLR